MRKSTAKMILDQTIFVRLTDVTVQPPQPMTVPCSEWPTRLIRHAIRRLKGNYRVRFTGGHKGTNRG